MTESKWTHPECKPDEKYCGNIRKGECYRLDDASMDYRLGHVAYDKQGKPFAKDHPDFNKHPVFMPLTDEEKVEQTPTAQLGPGEYMTSDGQIHYRGQGLRYV